mmetsp:Transcript_28555/g.25496  ORF Transcript_28555/g.25496 Transcript_28555/m.25496 type:complete len:751 (-) Transcript_28555:1254-3506(-)
MGDWIISKFLDITRSKEHAKLVGEISLSDNDCLFYRLKSLNKFVLTELRKSLMLSKAEAMNKFNALVPFVETLISAMRSVPIEIIQQRESNPEVLEFTQDDLDVLYRSYDNYNASSNSKIVIKLIIMYLFTPQPFKVSGEGLIKYGLDRIWTAINKENKTNYYDLFSSMVIGSNVSAKWFLAQIDVILQDIFDKLDNFNHNNFKALRYSFNLLNNISINQQIKTKITNDQWHLKLYGGLKNKNIKSKVVLKEIDTDILKLAAQFLKNICIGNKETELQLANALIEDLAILETKRDLFFINNLLVPLLNSESDIPVCFHPYDHNSKKAILDEKKLVKEKKVEEEKKKEQFTSNILNQQRTETLLKNIDKYTTNTGLAKKLASGSWEKVATQGMDSDQNMLVQLRQKLANKGPFVVVMQGMNAGKQCYCGVFCSQPMANIPETIDSSNDQQYSIPMAEDNFIFYYEDGYSLHFPIPTDKSQTYFGQIQTFYDGGGALCFYHNNSERFFISFCSQTTYVDINLYDMTPQQEDKNQTYPSDIPAEFTFTSAEYFLLKTDAPAPVTQAQKNRKDKGSVLANVLCPAWYHSNHPLNYYRATPVYNVPAALNVERMVEIVLKSEGSVRSKLTKEKLDPKTAIAELFEFVLNDPNTNGIIDVEFDAQEISEKALTNIATSLVTDPKKYKPAMNIFNAFEESKGVEKLINTAIKSLKLWKNRERVEKWETWLKELSSFSALPNFFGLFMKDKDCIDLFF